MSTLKLPKDLVAFLRTGKQFQYEPSDCEAGAVTLLALDALRLQLFPVDCQSTPVERRDPNYRSLGCYLIPAVSLLATAEHYDPDGLLLWLPQERRYGGWDSSHDGLSLYPRDTTWADIARRPVEYINANWHSWDGMMECPTPWHRYRHYHEQVHWPVTPVPCPREFEFRVLTYQAIFRERSGSMHGKMVGYPGVAAQAEGYPAAKRALRDVLSAAITQDLAAESPLPQPRLATAKDGPCDERTMLPIALQPE